MSSIEPATAPAAEEVPVVEAAKVEEAAPAPAAAAVEEPVAEAPKVEEKAAEAAPETAAEEAKPAEEAKEAAPSVSLSWRALLSDLVCDFSLWACLFLLFWKTPKKEKKPSTLHKLLAIFNNKKEKSPKKETKAETVETAEPAKVEVSCCMHVPTSLSSILLTLKTPFFELGGRWDQGWRGTRNRACCWGDQGRRGCQARGGCHCRCSCWWRGECQGEHREPRSEGLIERIEVCADLGPVFSFLFQIDDAAKKEDATAPSAAQKEKLTRRLSARVGGLFNKPKKEVAATESKPTEVTDEKIAEAAPKSPAAATPVVASA
jgi:chemotaxis protein histidine kinase CheA